MKNRHFRHQNQKERGLSVRPYSPNFSPLPPPYKTGLCRHCSPSCLTAMGAGKIGRALLIHFSEIFSGTGGCPLIMARHLCTGRGVPTTSGDEIQRRRWRRRWPRSGSRSWGGREERRGCGDDGRRALPQQAKCRCPHCP